MAAALHVDLSVHNFGIQEYMPHTADTDRVFPHSYSFGDGAMHPGDSSGLGVDIDEALAATSPAWRGHVTIAGQWEVPVMRFLRYAAAVAWREAGF